MPRKKATGVVKGRKEDTAKVEITMNMDQAWTLMNATEFYARIHIGQFNHIDTEFSCNAIFDCEKRERKFWEDSDKRSKLNAYLFAARDIIFPELSPYGANASHGIPSRQISPNAHNAWDIYQTVRYTLAMYRDPNPTSYSVSYNKPMSISEVNPLPHVNVLTDETKDKSGLLKEIAALIRRYEDPTGCNCSNDVMAEVSFNFGKEVYLFNGESFDKIKPKKKVKNNGNF